jgi:excisionase family DNA binding protein
MSNEPLTFNDLPQVVAELRDEVSGMKALLLNLQNRPTQQRENRHRPVTPEQVAEYTNIPLATIYQKLANREIPGSKPGKRWVIYLDEIDKWLEANRKNPIPLTDEHLRLVRFYDEEQSREFMFLTNAMELTAQQVADLYKNRWQIELFFYDKFIIMQSSHRM